jgi:hypothetical protein
MCLQLEPGESVIVRAFADRDMVTPWPGTNSVWKTWKTIGAPFEITGRWKVDFVQGGPTMPTRCEIDKLASWTAFADTNAQPFAGSAKYEIRFDVAAGGSEDYMLELGEVRQSARVKVNGKSYGTLFTAPFRVVVSGLKAKENLLEVEVTNTSANRIRDLDRRGVKWKSFHDINFVNLQYKPFDASQWPLAEAGMLGPVTLTACQPVP